MKNLKKLRTEHNLSQQELADIIHVSQQSIYKYENNITTPDLSTLKEMADYFDTSIDYLVGFTDIPHRIEPVTEFYLNEHELLITTEYRKLSAQSKILILELIKQLNQSK